MENKYSIPIDVTRGCPDCPFIQAYIREAKNRIVFLKQTECVTKMRIIVARCASCGALRRKVWWRWENEDEAWDKLNNKYFFCNDCNKWVCKDCYLVHTDRGDEICAKCANEKGILGLNDKQYGTELKKRPVSKAQAEENMRKYLEWRRNNEKTGKED